MPKSTYNTLRENLENNFMELAPYIRARNSLELLVSIENNHEKEIDCSILEAGDLQSKGHINILTEQNEGCRRVSIITPEFGSYERYIRVTEKGRRLTEKAQEYIDILKGLDDLKLLLREKETIKQQLNKGERLKGYAKYISGLVLSIGSIGGAAYYVLTQKFTPQTAVVGYGIGMGLGVSLVTSLCLRDSGKDDIRHARKSCGEYQRLNNEYKNKLEAYKTKFDKEFFKEFRYHF